MIENPQGMRDEIAALRSRVRELEDVIRDLIRASIAGESTARIWNRARDLVSGDR